MVRRGKDRSRRLVHTPTFNNDSIPFNLQTFRIALSRRPCPAPPVPATTATTLPRSRPARWPTRLRPRGYPVGAATTLDYKLHRHTHQNDAPSPPAQTSAIASSRLAPPPTNTNATPALTSPTRVQHHKSSAGNDALPCNLHFNEGRRHILVYPASHRSPCRGRGSFAGTYTSNDQRVRHRHGHRRGSK